jgi:hypothetical protein
VPLSSRLLILLIIARILVPPCMCLCKLEAPAARAIAWVLGTATPDAPAEEQDHDHHPGCPASYLSLGLGLRPLPFLEPESLLLSLPSFTPSSPADTTPVARDPIGASGVPAGPPLYVRHCALTV